MKKLLAVILLFASFAASAQVIKPKVYVAGTTPANLAIIRGGGRADSTWGIPYRDTNYIPEKYGDMVIRPADGVMYVYIGSWNAFQTIPRNIILTQGLHAINDSTAGLGGRFSANDTISGAGLYTQLYDSMVNFVMRGSNTNASHPNSAMLETITTKKGVLFSAMNTAQMLAITGLTPGIIVYNTDSVDYCLWNNVSWQKLPNIYTNDGALYGDRTLAGNNHSLFLGTNANKLSFADIYSNGIIGLFGVPVLTPFPVITNANYVAAANQPTFKLPVITANRTFTPPVAGGNAMIYIWNSNNSGFTWSPAAGFIFKDATGTTLSSFANSTFYQFMNDGTNWIQVGAASGFATDNGAYHTVTSLNDSTFTLNRPDGTKDTIQIKINNLLGTPTLQSVMTASSILNTTNTINFGTNNLIFKGNGVLEYSNAAGTSNWGAGPGYGIGGTYTYGIGYLSNGSFTNGVTSIDSLNNWFFQGNIIGNGGNTLGISNQPWSNIYVNLGTAPAVMFTQSANKTIQNTTSVVSLFGTGVGSLTIGGGGLQVGRVIKIRLAGVYSTALSPGNMTFNVKLGSTVIANNALTSVPSSASNYPWELNLEITCSATGGAGSVNIDGTFQYFNGIANSAKQVISLNNNGSGVNVSTIISNLLDVTFNWSALSASNIITTTTANVIEYN